jgi:hypothetical protein
MTRLMAALPKTQDILDAAALGASMLGVRYGTNLLFSKLMTPETYAKSFGRVPYSDQAVVTVGASMLTAFISPRWGKRVLLGGLLSIATSLLNRHVVGAGWLGADLKKAALDFNRQESQFSDYVTFGHESMGSYVQFPASRAGQSMGDFVQFGQFSPGGPAMSNAALLPSYQQPPYDVGMPMGDYDDVEGYYGVTAY